MIFKRRSSGRLFIFLVAALIIGLTGFSAMAEEKTITLSEAYRVAVTTHESAMSASEDVYQTEKLIDKAISQALPVISLDGNYTKYSKEKKSGGTTIQPDDTTSYNVRISQPLYTGGKEWNLWRQAKLKNKAGAYGFNSVRQEIMLNVAKAYFSVLKAAKNVEIKESALKRVHEQKRVAAARFQVGDVTKSIVLRAEADAANTETDLINARKDMRIAKDRLARLIGTADDFKTIDPNIQPMSDLNPDRLTLLSLEKRQDYIQSRIDEEIAVEAIGYADGNFLPSLKLEGVYSWRDQDPGSPLSNRESIYGGITLTYPLFEGGLRKAELDEAKSKRRQAELKRHNLRKEIELEVREAFHNLEAFNAIINSYKRQLSFAEENYNMVFKQFTYGLATNVDVIDANNTLVSSQNGLANAVYDYQAAIVDLKKKTGILIEEIELGEK